MSSTNPIPCTGKDGGTILDYYGLPGGALNGAEIFDLGCGQSDLQADLGRIGIEADVAGFDEQPMAFALPSETRKVRGDISRLDIPDGSADVVLATYSLPLWGDSVKSITNFYAECTRLVRPDGILGIFPITASRNFGNNSSPGERLRAAVDGARRIRTSNKWLNLSANPQVLLVRKI